MALIAFVAFSQTDIFGQAPYFPHPAGLQGFPISGTSVSASHQLQQNGFLDSLTGEEFEADESSSTELSTAKRTDGSEASSGLSSGESSRSRFDITPEYGAFKSPNLKGNTYTLPLYSKFKLSDRVGLSINLPVQYTQFRSSIGELDVWNASLTLGLPIKVIKKSDGLPVIWTVTPHGGAAGYFADDNGDSYTFTGHGGITSLVGYQTPHFSISMANQITAYQSICRSGSYNFTKAVNQEILKNGVKISVPFAGRWVTDVYGIHTKFLENAYMQDYVTLGGSIGYRLQSMKKDSYIKVGTYTELGKNYDSIHFQFGTGWKF